MKYLCFLIITLYANSVLCDKNIELTQKNFNSETKDRNYLVAFYSKGCKLSQQFLETYDTLAKELKADDGARFGSVDCVEHKDLCTSEDASSLEVHLYRPGQSKTVNKFNGGEETNLFVQFFSQVFADANLGKKKLALNELTDETFADHVASGNHFVKFYAPWCGHCQHMAPTWDELANSLEFDDTVSVSKIDCTLYRPICQDFEVKGYPTLLWIQDGKKIEKYSGSRKLEEFKAYIEQKTGAPIKQADEKATVTTDSPTDGHQEELSVLQLTGPSFDHAIEKGVTIIKFYAPWCGHCKRLVPTWDELATKYVGNKNVKIAKVDCTLSDNKDLCSTQEVDGFPTIFIYRNGDKVTEYNGNRSLEDLVNFVNRHRSDHDEL